MITCQRTLHHNLGYRSKCNKLATHMLRCGLPVCEQHYNKNEHKIQKAALSAAQRGSK